MTKTILLGVGCLVIYLAGAIHDLLGFPSWFDPIAGIGGALVFGGSTIREEEKA